MKKTDLSRRDFNRLSMAAFGGVVAGSLVGCNDAETPDTGAPPTPEGDAAIDQTGSGTAEGEGDAEHSVAYLAEEPHVCRGLNTCKGKGKSGDNECAGRGTCHNAEAHSCHYENACKGQGGCGEYPGQNACKEKGECAVPLQEATWKKAREAFEKVMAEKGKEVGPAPPKS